jgi:carbamoyl-phosphate synthase small subunit
VFLSNGPGDPAEVGYAVEAMRDCSARCRCSASASVTSCSAGRSVATPSSCPSATTAATTRCATRRPGKVEITSQNHNFCVDPASLAGKAEVTHLNLNDHTVEGMRVRDVPAFSVQYHPEAGPGPHDAKYLFAMFDD